MKKNDKYTVFIENTTVDGYGVCRIDGRAVFVLGALSGELWEILILKVTNTAVWAKGMHCITPSPARIEYDCPNPCGGCVLRHAEYSDELIIKQKYVVDSLQRIGKQSIDTVPIHASPSTLRYRNKAVFAVAQIDGKAAFGFYRPRSHDIIPVEDCLLQSELCVRAARAVTDFLNDKQISPYNELNGKGTVRHIFFRQSRCADALLCIVSARGFSTHTEELVDYLRSACPELTGIVLNINKSAGNTVLSGDFYTLWGNCNVRESFIGNIFSISPQAFLQVNPLQAELIYQKALEFATGPLELNEGSVESEEDTRQDSLKSLALELYCGAGTISLCLSKCFHSVIAAEIVPEAVENARSNAALNGITNVRFICADAGDVADRLNREGACPDAVVVDPPRKGLAKQTIQDIVRMKPERVVYISCNPATLARDLSIFSEEDYLLCNAEAFDMFPRTGHVETCVLLVRELTDNDEVVSIKVNMDGISLDQGKHIPQEKPTYQNIKKWINEKYGFNVSTLYIAQIKEKAGLEKRKNYNPGSGDGKAPICPPEKKEAIMDAFRHFGLI